MKNLFCGNNILELLLQVLFFSAENLLPIISAYYFAGKIALSFSARFAYTFFLIFLQWIILFALIGLTGALSWYTCTVGGVVFALILYCVGRKIPVSIQSETTFSTNLMLTKYLFIFIFGLCLLYLMKCTILPGTDTYLYHLYYPAMWLHTGKIHAVSMAGLPHEYFPICGELLYGWLLCTGFGPAFAALLQLFSLMMAFCAVYALWDYFKIDAIFLYTGILLTASTSIIMQNAILCYTDTLTGAFLVTGSCFIILA